MTTDVIKIAEKDQTIRKINAELKMKNEIIDDLKL
jgi:hypothetical protein